MSIIKVGPVEIIMGENDSRAPFSTCMVIKGKDNSALIECGAGMEALLSIRKQHNIKRIYLSHHHFDHTWGVSLFPDAEKFINPLDLNKALNTEELVKAQGFPAVLEEAELKSLLDEQHHFSPPGSDRVFERNLDIRDSYAYDQEFEVSGTSVMMIHSPGHTEGYCCPYLPEHGILYVGDFDLTSFGPFYCDADGNIDLFIRSAQKTLEIDAEYIVTAHQKGVMRKAEYKRKLIDYLAIIEKREQVIKRFIKNGRPPQELTKQSIFYYEEQTKRNPFYLKSEKLGIVKHLQRLIHQGEPFDEFYQEFLLVQNIKEKYTTYQSGLGKVNNQ
ncbi:MBL fold metallo-hydrolase [Mesobacillus harenae]|uniref:MBL fold metallo-hydrolase n=1 Tax=Mesobacillus harenae TaxID=2213203 RepID=UPI001580BE6D|nr:MBL fold metallo-hydrolase [Mesobacillus harenae]